MNIIEIDIISEDQTLIQTLLNAEINITGVDVVSKYLLKQRSDEGHQIFQIILSVSGGIFINMLSSWLYDHLKMHRNTRIQIDRKEVEFSNEGEIKKVLQETLRLEN